MSVTLDSFGRTIKASISELKAALTSSMDATKDSAKKEDENTEQLKQLNTNLANILGGQFHQEMKTLTKLIGDVAVATKEIAKIKSDRKYAKDIDDMIAGGVKKVMSGAGVKAVSRKGGVRAKDDLCQCICKCIKELNVSAVKVVAKAATKAATATAASATTGTISTKATRKKEREEKREASRRANLARKESPAYSQGAAAAEGLSSLFSGNAIDSLGRGVSSIVGTVISGAGGAVGTAMAALGAPGGPLVMAITGFLGGFAEQLLTAIIKPFMEEIALKSEQIKTIWSQTGGGIKTAQEELEKFAVTGKDVNKTGVNELKTKKALIKNAQKGLGIEKDFRKVTDAGLQLSSQIGSDAEQTAEMFADWNMHLGLSNSQLHSISKGMQNISKETGLTGNNLLAVAKSSEQFMKNMKSAGTLSANAANNIMGILARGQKTGTSESSQRAVAALSTSALDEMDDATRNLQLIMMRGTSARQKNQYLGGTAIKDDDTVNLAAKNLKAFLKRITGKNFEDLTEEHAGIISTMTKRLLGKEMGLNDFRITIKNLEDQSKSYEDKLKDLNKQLKERITAGRKEAILQEMNNLFVGKSTAVLEDYIKTSTVGKSNLKNFLGIAKELNIDPSKRKDVISGMLARRVDLLRKDAKKFGSTAPPEDIMAKANEALRTNNNDLLKEVVTQIQELEADRDEKEREMANPFAKAEKQLDRVIAELKDGISKFIIDALPKLVEFLEWVEPKIEMLVTEISELVKHFTGKSGATTAMQNRAAQGEQAVKAAEKIDPQKLAPSEAAKLERNIKRDKANREAERKDYDAYVEEIKSSPVQIWGRMIGEGLNTITGGLFDPFKDEKATKEAIMAAREKEKNLIAINEQKLNEYNKLTPEQKTANEAAKAAAAAAAVPSIAKTAPLEAKAAKATIDFTKEGTDRSSKSIYVHDTHLEELIEPMVSSMLPNANPEDQMRLKQITQVSDDDLSTIEGNTGATAAGTKAMVKILGQIGRMLSKKLKNGDLGSIGPDSPVEAFYDEILNTEWPNARIGRKVGLEFDYTDIS